MKAFPRSIAVVVGAVAIASGVIASSVPASAQWHRGDVGAGIAAGAVTGFAVGALTGAAAANDGYGYGYAPVAPTYGPGPGCYLQRQRVWDGYGWRIQRVQICE